MVYTIIRKRQVFHALANLPCDGPGIARSLQNKRSNSLGAQASPLSKDVKTVDRKDGASSPTGSEPEAASMEGSRPALPAEPGTLNATLPDTPGNNFNDCFKSTNKNGISIY